MIPTRKPLKRCPWASIEDDAQYRDYHDCEWGVPVHDDRRWFEFLVLEGAQAGLSWATILHKRDNYRKAFSGFDPKRVAAYALRDRVRLLRNPGIVRNRLKIEATVINAQAFLQIQQEFGSFDQYIWRFVDGKPICSHRRYPSQVPSRTAISDIMSRDLKQRGFKFVGSTICYAFMQATGMVNDHLIYCFRYQR